MTRERRDSLLFDQISSQYARKDQVRSSAMARRAILFSALAPLLAVSPNLGTVLDIGCGVGAPAKYLRGHYERYIGVDHAPGMIAAARQFNTGNERAEFIAANIKDIELAEIQPDLILSEGALHHMTELASVLALLVTIARPGAWLVAREPQNGNPFIQFLRQVRVRLDRGYSQDQVFFAPSAMRQLLLDAGLQNVSVVCEGFFVPPFAQVVMNPQVMSVPLCRVAIGVDGWLHRWLPAAVRRLGFNMVAYGRFPETERSQ